MSLLAGQSTTEGNASEPKKAEGQAAAASASGVEGKTEGNPAKDAAAPADAGKEGKEGKAAEPAKVEGAPEKYADFKMPEGVKLEEKALGEFTTLAKDLNLSQDNAQKLMDLAAKHTQDLVSKQTDAWDQMQASWVKELKEDKDFGGQKFGETVERVKRTMKRFGAEGDFAELDGKGYLTLPQAVRLLAKIDKATSEDEVIDGGASKETKSAADTIYG